MSEKEVRLIDANAMIGSIMAAVENDGMGLIIANTFKRYVLRQPTIDPESLRLHGKWTADHRCTNCGEYALPVFALPPAKDPESDCYYHTIYCPWCGAKMEE